MSQGKGPSKGKGQDPGNWGDVNFSDEEINLDNEHAVLESWEAAQEWAHSQSDIPQNKELPAGDMGVEWGQVITWTPAHAETPVVTMVARAVDSSEENESSKTVSSKKHKKKRTYKKKV